MSSLTVHRFILTSITIASKAFCDAFATNPQFARVGGVSLVELNLLEKEFLAVLDWRLAVSFAPGLVTPTLCPFGSAAHTWSLEATVPGSQKFKSLPNGQNRDFR